MKTKLLQLWYQLNDRERYLLLWGGVFLLVYLAYMMYASLAEAVVQNTQRLAEKKETLAWMKQAEKQLSPKHTGQSLDKAQGLTVFSQQLKTATFHAFAYQLQQLNDDELQLSFDKVPYNGFLAWLSQMSMRYKITVKQFHVERTEDQGLVKLMVVIAIHADDH